MQSTRLSADANNRLGFSLAMTHSKVLTSMFYCDNPPCSIKTVGHHAKTFIKVVTGSNKTYEAGTSHCADTITNGNDAEVTIPERGFVEATVQACTASRAKSDNSVTITTSRLFDYEKFSEISTSAVNYRKGSPLVINDGKYFRRA